MAKASTTWKKGQSGNPKGRPKKGQTVTELLTELGQEMANDFDGLMPGELSKERTRAEALALTLWRKAIGGDMTAAKVIIERVDGLPVKQVQMISAYMGAAPMSAEDEAEYHKAVAGFFGTAESIEDEGETE